MSRLKLKFHHPQGTPYYANGSSGNDGNTGLSSGQAWGTLSKVATSAPAGANVYCTGTFTGQTIFNKSVHLIGQPGSTPILDGTGINFTNYTGLLYFLGTSGAHIGPCSVTNFGVRNVGTDDALEQDAIRARYVDGITITYNIVVNVKASGIGVWDCNDIQTDHNWVQDAQNTADPGLLHEECMTFSRCGNLHNAYNIVEYNTVCNVLGSGNLGGVGICFKENCSYFIGRYNNIFHLTRTGAMLLDAWSSSMHHMWLYGNTISDCLSGIALDCEAPGSAGHLDSCWVHDNSFDHINYAAISMNVVSSGTGDGLRSNIHIWNNSHRIFTGTGGGFFLCKTTNISGDFEIKNNFSDMETVDAQHHAGHIRINDAAWDKVTDCSGNYAWDHTHYNPDDHTPATPGDPTMSEYMAGVTFVDPQLVDRLNSFEVYNTSPLIGAVTALTDHDYYGNPRTIGQPCDVGAIEFVSPPSPPSANILTPEITFEVGDLSEFDLTSGAGLAVGSSYKIQGSQGLQVSPQAGGVTGLARKGGYLYSNNEFAVQIYIDPNSGAFSPSTATTFLLIKNSSGAKIAHLDFGYATTTYNLDGCGWNDDGVTYNWGSTWTISDAPHRVGVYVTRATGPSSNDGVVTLKIDGAAMQVLSGLDNYTIMDGTLTIDVGYAVGSLIHTMASGAFLVDQLDVSGNLIEIGARG
jgi:hypothetical protein